MRISEKLSPDQRIVYAVGAFILCAQEVERTLKFVIPFLDETDSSLGSILNRQRRLEKTTLGLLAQRFVGSTTGDTNDLQTFIETIIRERNEVIHHFTQSFGSLIEAGKHDEVLRTLRRRHERSLQLLRILREIALSIAECLRDGVYRGTEKEAEFTELCNSFRTSLTR